MNLKEYLFYEKQSITDMAKLLKISRNHLSRIACGKMKPSWRLARDIEQMTKGKVIAEDLLRGEKDDEGIEKISID